jgi:hypothetical protein
MNDKLPLHKTMREAASQALENMVFLDVIDHYNQDLEIPAGDLSWASLAILEPAPGEIRLLLPKYLLRNMTSMIFSLAEDEITQKQMDDIHFELLNTICGLFMTRFLAADQTYKIGLPQPGTDERPVADHETIIWKLMTNDEDLLQIHLSGKNLINYPNRV